MISVLEFFPDDATVHDELIDCTPYFLAGLEASLSLYVPVRRDQAHTIIPYRIAGLILPNGGQIICESADTHLDHAESGGMALIKSKTHTKGCRLQGGSWRSSGSALHLWHHSGKSALAYCEFRDMTIDGFTSAFRFETAVGTLWSRVHIVNCAIGWHLGNSAKVNAVNHNTIRDSRLSGCKEAGVLFQAPESGTRVQPRRGNLIERSVFEDAFQGGEEQDGEENAAPPVCAVRATAGVSNLVIRGCYFERAANSAPDIDLLDLGVDDARHLPVAVVEECTFNGPLKTQSTRIAVEGHASVLLRDNAVVLKGPGTHSCPFLKASSVLGRVECRNNRLQGPSRNSYLRNLVGQDTLPDGVFYSEY